MSVAIGESKWVRQLVGEDERDRWNIKSCYRLL